MKCIYCNCTESRVVDSRPTEDGAIRFDLDLVLSLREIGLAPPVLLGVIRVGDRVPVRVRVALDKAPEN